MHDKNLLSEFIYNLQLVGPRLYLPQPVIAWSHPVAGFAYDNSLPTKIVDEIKKQHLISEDISSIICILADWEEVLEGIIFTDKSIYVKSPKNKDNVFHVSYDEIKRLVYFQNPPILRIGCDSKTYTIDTKLWGKCFIYNFLQFACCENHFHEDYKSAILNINLKWCDNKSVEKIISGITYGNISNASSMYFDDKIVSPKGHGFAAEHANHLMDVYLGKDSYIVGDDNLKNGADRLVNGINIQSKYCRSGSDCIKNCFSNGEFRYWNPDGTPMKIEVPSDMYDSAIQAMKHRIEKGEVKGIADPKEAENIIVKGHFTYAQAKNIAKAGTIESIVYDAASGIIIARNAMGITATISLAMSLWNGAELDIAIKNATIQAIKVGGTTFITAILAGQLSKAGLNSLLVGSTEKIVGILGPKASAVLINAFRSGTNIYGAAAVKSLAKSVRTNIITATAAFVVLSAGDVSNIFRGRISGKQLFKNLTNTASSMAGGSAGWIGGTMAGSLLGPVGAGLGGIIGALGGGKVASELSGKALNHFIEDDAEEMVRIIQKEFAKLAEEYLVNQKEAEDIVEALKCKLTGKILKDMYSENDRYEFARNLMINLFEDVNKCRKYVYVPTLKQMQLGLRSVLEDIANEESKTSVE